MRRTFFAKAVTPSNVTSAACGVAPLLNSTQAALTQDVRNFYNNQGPGGGRDRNWVLSQCDTAPVPITNHHYGMGNYNPDVTTSQDLIAKELHRLECNQIEWFERYALQGPLTAKDVALDAGSGRGGTAFRLWDRSEQRSARIYGVTIAEDQCEYANSIAQKNPSGLGSHVSFSVQDMVTLPNPPHPYFTAIYMNETDMYVQDLVPMFRRFATLLKNSGGGYRRRFGLSSWCNNHQYGKRNEYSEKIDDNYRCVMHTDKELQDSLSAAGFEGITVTDVTKDALPYWELRSMWELKSGVEEPFIQGFKTGKVRYVFVSAVV